MERNSYLYAAHQGNFSICYSPEGERSMNMRALAKVLILMTGIFLSLVLQN